MSVEIREITAADVQKVSAMICDIARALVLDDFLPEGKEEFLDYVSVEKMTGRLVNGDENDTRVLAAFDEGEAVAMIEVGLSESHLSLFFTRTDRQGEGLGRALFDRAAGMCRERGAERMDVHSSRVAVPVYERLGFAATGAERTENGILYIPMDRVL